MAVSIGFLKQSKGVIERIVDDPKLRDAGTLLWASGLFRAMYLGASTVAEKKDPNKDQLGMFRYGGIIEYLVKFFSTEAGESYRNDENVKMMLETLKEIEPIVKKMDPDKQDIAKIAEALGKQFS